QDLILVSASLRARLKTGCTKETGPHGPVSCPWSGRSEVLVRLRGGAVHGVLCHLLGVANRLLALALRLLHRAFAFQAIGAGGFADALLGLAHCLVGFALDLVGRATHGTLRSIARRGVKPLIAKKFLDSRWPLGAVLASFPAFMNSLKARSCQAPTI